MSEPAEAKRLHPLVAPLRIVGHGVQGLGIPVFLLAMASLVIGDWALDSLFVVAPLGFVLGAGYGLASYLRFEYALAENTLNVESGVFGRVNREIPYRRIQNVDIQQRLLHRLFRQAVVRIETAGGGGTEAELDFVSLREADRIQYLVRSRRSSPPGTANPTAEAETRPAVADESTEGESPSDGESTDGDVHRPSPESGTRTIEPTTLFSLSLSDLLVYALATVRPGAFVIAVLGIPIGRQYVVGSLLSFVRSMGGATSLATLTLGRALVTAAVLVPIVLVATYVVSAAYSAVAYYGFELREQGGDLLYEHGLIGRYSGSIPRSKVQTVTIRETLPMRWLGYAGLIVETAGYAPGTSGTQSRGLSSPPSAVPAADRETALGLARRIEAFGPLDFKRPPKRARRRYAVRYGLVACALVLLGYLASLASSFFADWYLLAAAFVLVPVAAHLTWVHRGYAVGDDHVVIRRGFWTRRTVVVPYDHLQTVSRERTIFQRRLDLANVVADTAGSLSVLRDAPTALDIDGDDARQLHERCRRRLRESVGRV